jgi:hypothetical protein
MRLRGGPGKRFQDLRCDTRPGTINRLLSPLCINAGLIARGLQFSNTVFHHAGPKEELIQINTTRTITCLPASLHKEEQMKPLSEQLAELSVHAKGAENAFADAKKEARDKIEARKAEALSAAKTAVEKVNQQIKSAGESATRDTKALQAKITADVNALKAHVVEAKHGLDVKLAEKQADLLESDAGFAIDYAIASVEQARLAVLDAIDARFAADQARRS